MISVRQLELLSKNISPTSINPFFKGIIFEGKKQRILGVNNHMIIAIHDKDICPDYPNIVIPADTVAAIRKLVPTKERKTATVEFKRNYTLAVKSEEELGAVAYTPLEIPDHWINFDNVLLQAKHHDWEHKKGKIGWYGPKYIDLLNAIIDCYKDLDYPPKFIFPPDVLSPMTVQLVTDKQEVTIVISSIRLPNTNLEG